MANFLGYISALIIGGTLGIFGGGGSILTVPVLVYLFHISPVMATAYSLFIVGTTTSVGAISQLRKRLVNFKAAITFSIPGITGTFLARRLLVPAIPENIFTINSYTLTKDTAILIFFSIIMLLASYSMIKGRKADIKAYIDKNKAWNIPLIVACSFLIGIITGVVGAGGGFLIIPALVFLMNLEMKQAVATSILIIGVNSLMGFMGSFMSGLLLDFQFLILFTILTIAGILVGIYFAKNIPNQKLKPAFGWFVMFMGALIIFKESIL